MEVSWSVARLEVLVGGEHALRSAAVLLDAGHDAALLVVGCVWRRKGSMRIRGGWWLSD